MLRVPWPTTWEPTQSANSGHPVQMLTAMNAVIPALTARLSVMNRSGDPSFCARGSAKLVAFGLSRVRISAMAFCRLNRAPSYRRFPLRLPASRATAEWQGGRAVGRPAKHGLRLSYPLNATEPLMPALVTPVGVLHAVGSG